MDKGLSVSRIDVCCNNVSLICLFGWLVGWFLVLSSALVHYGGSRNPKIALLLSKPHADSR